MHVCHLINSLEHGGAENHLLEMARANFELDTDLTLSVCSIEENAPLASEFREIDVDVQNFGASFKFDPRSIARMALYFRRRDVDILHTHLPLAHSIGRPIARLAGVETIVSTQHNVADNYHPITGTLEKITRSLDTRTIAVSEGVKQSFSTSGQSWETIYNGIDVDTYNETVANSNPEGVRERWGVGNDLVFLNIGRYQPEKSQRDLIDAMAVVAENEPNATLLLVGSGDLEDVLRRQIREQGLESNVELTGHVPSVTDYYALADVFVSSSLREGLPITFLEAMATGLPIVGTDIPGVNELVVDGETGRLAPPQSPDELADRMLEFTDPDRRREFGEAGLDRVRSQFDIARTLEEHIRLYRELLDEPDATDENVIDRHE